VELLLQIVRNEGSKNEKKEQKETKNETKEDLKSN
jgi:hypothetical protein